MSKLIYLYKRGDLCESVSGGWDSWSYAERGEYNNAQFNFVNFASDHVQLNATGIVLETNNAGLHGRACMHTKTPIDLTNVAGLQVDFTINGNVGKEATVIVGISPNYEDVHSTNIYRTTFWRETFTAGEVRSMVIPFTLISGPRYISIVLEG